VNLKQPVSRAVPFRLFVCFCLIWQTGSDLYFAGPTLPLVVLLVLLVLWAVASSLASRRDDSVMALALHAIESAALPGLFFLLPVELAAAAVLVGVAGAAAVGGWRFLATSLSLTTVSLIGLDVAGLTLSMSSTLYLVLLSGFLIAISIVSFGQARRLHRRGSRARRLSERIGAINSHLERYLPVSVRERSRAGVRERQPPVSCWVTVAFIDLVGFTGYVRSRDPAEIVEVVDGYQAGIDALAERHGAVLGKLLGDGALVYYPDDGDRGLNAVRCLRMLNELPALLGELNGRWRQRGHLVDLKVRSGVASGFCALGDWGSDERLEHTAIGDCVNLASRLQEAAEPNSGLVCEVTAALVCGQTTRPTGCQPFGAGRSVPLRGVGDVLAYPLVDVAGRRL